MYSVAVLKLSAIFGAAFLLVVVEVNAGPANDAANRDRPTNDDEQLRTIRTIRNLSPDDRITLTKSIQSATKNRNDLYQPSVEPGYTCMRGVAAVSRMGQNYFVRNSTSSSITGSGNSRSSNAATSNDLKAKIIGCVKSIQEVRFLMYIFCTMLSWHERRQLTATGWTAAAANTSAYDADDLDMVNHIVIMLSVEYDFQLDEGTAYNRAYYVLAKATDTLAKNGEHRERLQDVFETLFAEMLPIIVDDGLAHKLWDENGKRFSFTPTMMKKLETYLLRDPHIKGDLEKAKKIIESDRS